MPVLILFQKMPVLKMPIFSKIQKNARSENARFIQKIKKNARFDIARIPGLILPVFFSQKLRKCQFMFIKKTLG